MGTCVSSHNKNTHMKLTVQIQSPNKVNTTAVSDQHLAAGHSFLPQPSAMGHVDSFRDFSGKEETFLDSHTWLESDCEDFFSVNGDLTPSCDSTPIQQKSLTETSQLDRIPYTDTASNSKPQPSPTDVKKQKQLIELFRESFKDDPAKENMDLKGQKEAKATILDRPPISTKRSPYQSEPSTLYSTKSTPHRGSDLRRKNSAESAQCCIPSFKRSLSFSERKKSPANANEC